MKARISRVRADQRLTLDEINRLLQELPTCHCVSRYVDHGGMLVVERHRPGCPYRKKKGG